MPFFGPAGAGQPGLYIPGANPWGGRHRQFPDEAVGDALVLTDCVCHCATFCLIS